MDIKLNTTTGDIDVSTLDMVLLDGIESIRQHLSIRLRFFLGEWFLDTRIGVPYFESILIKNPNLDVVRSIYRETILTTTGVAELDQLLLDFDGVTRKLSVDFTAVTTDGETLDFSEEFIII